MSDADEPSWPPVPPPSPRDGCLTALMVICGIILLLPGVCAIIFVGSVGSSHPDPTVVLLVLLGLAVGAGGVLLIRAAIRGPRR